jgi:hypothetical protein
MKKKHRQKSAAVKKTELLATHFFFFLTAPLGLEELGGAFPTTTTAPNAKRQSNTNRTQTQTVVYVIGDVEYRITTATRYSGLVVGA